ncbi:MAG: DUF4917 family protein [Nocardioidaceae bacterium]|nr:DUF4917 family protein [Nocardioidaceae bacterium]
MTLATFAEALADDRDATERSVLLGNGFSRAFSDEFAYGRLRDVAEMPDLSVDRDRLFGEVGSDDFETVMDRLRATAGLVGLYSARSTRLAGRLREDASVVQRGLVEAISRIHPASSAEVTDEEYAHAVAFLAHFGRVFTVSYDLLLYWAVLHAGGTDVVRKDRFLRPRSGQPLRWIPPRKRADQSLFYLHGAVHLYMRGDVVHKLERVDGPLVEQLVANLEKGRYPLVVTEGTRADKEARIARNPYLAHCHAELASTAGSLFVHGLSLSDNDGHLLDAIAHRESRVDRLYVGVHGSAPGRDRRQVQRRAAGLEDERAENGGDPLTVSFYDAASAEVWRSS